MKIARSATEIALNERIFSLLKTRNVWGFLLSWKGAFIPSLQVNTVSRMHNAYVQRTVLVIKFPPAETLDC